MAKQAVQGLADNEYLSVAAFTISRAKKELLISTYRLQIYSRSRAGNFFILYKALIEALARGVRVRLLAQYSEKPGLAPHSNEVCMSIFKSKGAAVRFLPRGRIAHAKMIIADDDCLIVGSHNWSISSLTRNFEFSVLLHDPAYISQAKNHFLNAWSKAIPFK